MARILVTGGAGYIGSHMVLNLLEQGFQVVVLDNLSNSTNRNIDTISHLPDVDSSAVTFITGDVLQDLDRVTGEIDAVIHFAALKSVSESMSEPNSYYQNNTYGVVKLLEWMRQRKVGKLIFSSTAAVYGTEGDGAARESDVTSPISAYGKSKLFAEQIIADATKAYGIKAIAFRYFNVAGNDLEGRIGDETEHPIALIPAAVQTALGLQEKQFTVFGDKFDTPDGSAIRDFVHVLDLVEAHRLGLAYLDKSELDLEIINLGTKSGTSVLEALHMVETVTGKQLNFQIGAAREGDIVVSIADATKAEKLLGWRPKYDLHDMVESNWRWYSNWLPKS